MATSVTAHHFATMPDGARLWVFAATRPLTEAESAVLRARVDDFVAGWKAHGSPVVGAYQWRHSQFLLVAADEAATGVSGCSIDSLFRVLRDVERELDVPLLDPSHVWYRAEDGSIRCDSRLAFRERVQRGEVDAETTVFDNTVASVGALRAEEWERPMRDSWHWKAFVRNA